MKVGATDGEVEIDDKPQGDAWDVETVTATLADVGGMQSVKDRLTMAFLAPLRNPEIRKLYGKSLNGGLLLYGPPRMRQDLHRPRARWRGWCCVHEHQDQRHPWPVHR